MTTRYFSPSCALSNYSIKRAFVTFTLIALSPFIATAEFGPQRMITGNAGGVIEAASLTLKEMETSISLPQISALTKSLFIGTTVTEHTLQAPSSKA